MHESASLTTLLIRLNELRLHFRHRNLVREALSFGGGGLALSDAEAALHDAASAADEASVATRRIEYTASIVTLYGALEQFIEESIREHVRHINQRFQSYAEVPTSIRESHLRLSAEILPRSINLKGLQASDPEEIVKNLNSCFANDSRYTMNAEAFAYHTTNFRHNSINELFISVGVVQLLSRMRETPPLSNLLSHMWPGESLAGKNLSDIYRYIDDLAERRNEVAHGDVSNVASDDILGDYVDFVEQFCVTLSKVVSSDRHGIDAEQGATDIGRPVAVHDNRIICFRVFDTNLKVGDWLIAKKNSGSRLYERWRVEELQCNGIACEAVQADNGSGIEVAVRIVGRALSSWNYFLMAVD